MQRQCTLLSLTRSTLYYTLVGETIANLSLMRQMAHWLQREGHEGGQHRVRRLMRKMRLRPIYQAPRTSDPNPAHKIYPYMPKNLKITRPDHALRAATWCTYITYIPMQRGFLYIVAIMD